MGVKRQASPNRLKLGLPHLVAGAYVLAVAALKLLSASHADGDFIYDVGLMLITLPWSLPFWVHVSPEMQTLVYGVAAAANGFLLYNITRALTGGFDPKP